MHLVHPLLYKICNRNGFPFILLLYCTLYKSYVDNKSSGAEQLPRPNLYTESHDGVDYVTVVLFQCLDSLVAGNVCLGHDKLNILVLKSLGVNLLIIFLLLLLLVSGLNGLALAVVVSVVVAGVVMASVVVGVSSCELLGGGCLCLGVEVLNLGLAEDAKGKL